MRENIGNNSHGNKNEEDFVKNLKKGLDKINLNLKEFIKYICKNEKIEYSSIKKFSAEYESNTKLKQDCYIFINENKYGISLKMGSGNSVHQEKCEDFIKYIKKEFNANEEICNLWRFFLWADGTKNGTGSMDKDEKGNILSRFNATIFKKKYPNERKKLQNFLNENEKKLIEHFLFEGRYNSKVDYIYHGTPQFGSWINKDKIINLQLEYSNLNSKKESCLSVGKMSIQSWNISMKGTSETKRGQLQVKYGKIKDDIKTLMDKEKSNIGTLQGDFQEYNLSKLLNKYKNNKFWNILINEKERKDYFVVKVKSKQKSSLSNKKVFPKSDAYVIKACLNSELLLKNEYVLTEDDLANIKYEIVPNTGISIKLKDSTNFTTQKFTKDSFIKAFKNSFDEEKSKEMLLSLLIYSDERQIDKNYKIAKDLGVSYKKFKNKKRTEIKKEVTEVELLDLIRKNAQNELKDVINSDESLKLAIFTGKGWFNDPYYAKFIYVNGDLKENTPTDFSITTGSGRSKGKYTIEIKPKR